MSIKKIGILTSGGDCCGLNAVIESVVKTASKHNIEVIGFKNGYDGLYDNNFEELSVSRVRGISCLGGTILGNSNKTNLFNHKTIDKDGNITYKDDSSVALKNIKDDNVDCLIIVGGDGSMTSARDFKRMGVNVVCVPKTIDNDVPYTDQTFGYSTAVSQIAKALEAIRTTGLSHDRVMLLEVMGRHAGWLALEGGLAGDADFILIPEIEFNVDHIVERLNARYKAGFKSTVIVVSEGATPVGGEITTVYDPRYKNEVRLGGIGEKLAHAIEAKLSPLTNQEVRSTNLGYVQRGGTTNHFDRVLSFRYGSFAVDAAIGGKFGQMVALRGVNLEMVQLEEVVGNGPTGETSKGGMKNVSMSSDLLRCAKSMDIYFGE